MNDQDIMDREDFQSCVGFHGHICPGISLGYRAAKAAMAKLAEYRAGDEELVAILETDACFADAVQVLTGCTFGKGNFIHRDYGKLALTLLSRKSGRGVRVCLRDGVFASEDEHAVLLKKIMQNEANEKEQQRFGELRDARSRSILRMDETSLFKVEETHTPLPPRAQMAPSRPCDQCKEPTMATKLLQRSGHYFCRACAGNEEA